MCTHADGRTPQGVRGLKPGNPIVCINNYQSHSARSAWIETIILWDAYRQYKVALRKECVD